MKNTSRTLIAALYLLTFGLATRADLHAADLIPREWQVDGVTREALVHVPAAAKTNAAPVVFAFHGHGGTMRNAARTFGYHTIWPEAIVVYMQGLNTPGRLTDPEGKRPGWQHGLGDQGDRDLKFFDAVLASLKADCQVDARRIYSTGHSNGGGFTYLLWAARGEQFAAFAPSAAVARSLFPPGALLPSEPRASASEKAERDSPPPGEARKRLGARAATRLPENRAGASDSRSASTEERPGERSGNSEPRFLPKPVLHVAGENDELVKFEWQKLMIAGLRKFNQCGEGKPWEHDQRCTIYESKIGAPVVTYITPGTHKFPEEAPKIIVRFFQEHARPE